MRFWLTWNCSRMECGKRAIMPMKIMREMPLPIPRSVICSPSHIMNIVPAVRKTSVLSVKPKPWTSGGTMGTPAIFMLVSRTLTPHAWSAAMTTVPYRVSCVIFRRPSSPSFESFWK